MKVKLFLLVIITSSLSSTAIAQANASGKYYYSEVQVNIGGFNKYKSISISFGTDYPVEVEKKDEIISKVSKLK